jgi:6-phosphogluconolactonase
MLLPLLAIPAMTPQADLGFYVGTYTSKEGSKGIYHVRLDAKMGALSEPELAAEAEAPSFLALHPNGHFLYAVHESTGGEVSAYAVGADRKLRLLNTQNAKTGGPCHLSVDHAGKNLFTAGYGGGSFASLPIKADGSLGPVTSFIQNAGSGPDKGRQEGPHAHSIYAAKGDRYVYGCDLGTDEVLIFGFDPAKGELRPGSPRSVKPLAGGGPRHLAFHPSGKYAFANNEMGNSVTAMSVDDSTGGLRPFQTVSTLPAGEGTKGKSTAEIACHPSGKWLYVSNRGHDSIAVFRIGTDGTMSLVEIEPAGVRIPRGFDIDPSGKWLVVAGQSSNDLVSFAIDGNGRLRPVGSRVSIGKPVCVLFQR